MCKGGILVRRLRPDRSLVEHRLAVCQKKNGTPLFVGAQSRRPTLFAKHMEGPEARLGDEVSKAELCRRSLV